MSSVTERTNPFGNAEVTATKDTTPEELNAAIDRAEASKVNAVHVFTPYPDARNLCGVLYSRQYKYRTMLADKLAFEHYKWMATDREDMVPSAYTFIAGSSLLLIGLDGSVLVIKELKANGQAAEKWKAVSGGVDLNEDHVQAAVRELLEEVGIDLAKLTSNQLSLMGGWSKPNARPGGINDAHLFFGVQVNVRVRDGKPVIVSEDGTEKPLEMRLAPHEIAEARWIPYDEFKAMMAPDEARKNFLTPDWFRFHAEGRPLGPPVKERRRGRDGGYRGVDLF